jgi:hypothetical protein
VQDFGGSGDLTGMDETELECVYHERFPLPITLCNGPDTMRGLYKGLHLYDRGSEGNWIPPIGFAEH